MSFELNKKARIEKKISKTAKELLLALVPSLKCNAFSVECDTFKSYHGTVYHEQHVVWFGPDYWGESDCDDCYQLLYSWLIDNTTDFKGMFDAEEKERWHLGGEVTPLDLTPFYSPWRGASRAEVIGHCRDLVRAGVFLEGVSS